jgi:hypothetical protein
LISPLSNVSAVLSPRMFKHKTLIRLKDSKKVNGIILLLNLNDTEVTRTFFPFRIVKVKFMLGHFSGIYLKNTQTTMCAQILLGVYMLQVKMLEVFHTKVKNL